MNLDQVLLDCYPEYQMLRKLKMLTNNFTCQSCMQVLNFQQFFDESHDCLNTNFTHGMPQGQAGSTPQLRNIHNESDSCLQDLKDSQGIIAPNDL